MSAEPPVGYVYVIQAEDGPVKVGISIDPRSRLQQISAASGRQFARVYVSPPVCDPRQFEKRAHRALQDSRTAGEWFDVSFDEARRVVVDLVEPAAALHGNRTAAFLRGKDIMDGVRTIVDLGGDTGAMLQGLALGASHSDAEAIACYLSGRKAIFQREVDAVRGVLAEFGMDADEIVGRALAAINSQPRSHENDNSLSFDGLKSITDGAAVTIK